MKLDQFPGLNTVNSPYELGFNGLARAENIDISKEGSVSRRPGRVKVYDGVITAAWGDGIDFLFIEGGVLKRLNADYSTTVLRSGLAVSTSLYAFRSTMNYLYWSTGAEHGVVVEGENREWSTSENNYWSGEAEEAVLADELHQDPMPVGTQMIEYMGRIWVVYDNMLIYTDPYSELTDLRENFIPVGERITNFGAVSDGLVVTTNEHTYFLSGRDPAEMSMDEKAPFGGISNTMIQVDGRVLGEGQNTLGLLWTSDQGICGGLPGGAVINITQAQIKELSGIGGAALLRELNGQQHYIVTLQN